jgi:hypothetical protein
VMRLVRVHTPGMNLERNMGKMTYSKLLKAITRYASKYNSITEPHQRGRTVEMQDTNSIV